MRSQTFKIPQPLCTVWASWTATKRMARSTDPAASNSRPPKLGGEGAALLRSSTAAFWTSVCVATVSAWLFYDRYWRWRHHLAGGAHVDDAGNPLYAESAVWGVVFLAAWFVALLAARARRRLRRPESAGPLT